MPAVENFIICGVSSDVITSDQWKGLKWKVKYKGIGKFQPRTGCKSPEGSKIIALLFL
jgi:hypothetical protein